MSGTEVNQRLIEKEKEYHDRLKATILDFTHQMNIKDVKIANQETEIIRLTQDLKEANDRLEKML